MPKSMSLIKTHSVGDVEPKLGKLFMPRAACCLPTGELIMTESSPTRLPIMNIEGELMRQLLPAGKEMDLVVATVFVPGDASTEDCIIIVSEQDGLIKVKTTGAEVARQKPEKNAIYVHGELIGGVLYILDNGNCCVRTYDPVTLQPRPERFGRRPPDAGADAMPYFDIDDECQPVFEDDGGGFMPPPSSSKTG